MLTGLYPLLAAMLVLSISSTFAFVQGFLGWACVLVFVCRLQHFVGPLEPGRYELEFLVMNAQTSDPSNAEKVCSYPPLSPTPIWFKPEGLDQKAGGPRCCSSQHCTPLAVDARLQRHQPAAPAQKQQWLCARERPFIPKEMRQVSQSRRVSRLSPFGCHVQ